MIVTTTPSIEGKKIIEYKGIVFGEVISGLLKILQQVFHTFLVVAQSPMKVN